MGKIRILIIGMLLSPVSAFAATYSGFLNVDIIGEVLNPPCRINDGNMITIDFEDVIEKDIDKGNYVKPIEYTLVCNTAFNLGMKMSISGTGASFNNKLLQTNFENLAVEFKANNNHLALKDKINFFYKTPPKLSVTLVKKANTSIPGGQFVANATLKVEYQ